MAFFEKTITIENFLQPHTQIQMAILYWFETQFYWFLMYIYFTNPNDY